MAMKTWLFILFLSVVCASAQRTPHGVALLNQRAASGGAIYPTNLAGFPALAWWKMEDGIVNGSGNITNVPDAWTGTYPVTATTSGAPFKQSGILNGYAIAQLDGTDDSLRRTGLSIAQALQITMIVCLTNTGAFQALYSDDSAVVSRMEVGSAALTFGGPTIAYAPTNKWVMIDIVINGASSTMYTNTVQGIDVGNPGSSALTAFGFGMNIRFSNIPGKYPVAEIVAYGNGNAIPATNSTARSNLFKYFTNKYSPAAFGF